jgi:hypothetical protein
MRNNGCGARNKNVMGVEGMAYDVIIVIQLSFIFLFSEDLNVMGRACFAKFMRNFYCEKA